MKQLGRPLLDPTQERIAALAAALTDQALERESATVLRTIPSGWRNSPSQWQRRDYSGEHGAYEIAYSMLEPFTLEGVGTVLVQEAGPERVAIAVGDEDHHFDVARYGDLRYVDSTAGPAHLTALSRFPSRYADEAPGSLHAPMPGKVIRLDAVEGQSVSEGDVLVVMEAMKMEHTLRSPHDGTVAQVLCEPGDQVESDAVLVVVDEA